MASSPQFDCDHITLPAGANISAYARVKLDSSGNVVVAGVTDRAVGYLTERGGVSGANCTVRLLGKPFNAIAAEAIEVGDAVYAAASGKVADTDGTGPLVGYALTAATGADQIVTVLRTDYIS